MLRHEVDPLHLGIRDAGVVVRVRERGIQLGSPIEGGRRLGHIPPRAQRETPLEVRFGQRFAVGDGLVRGVHSALRVRSEQRDGRSADVTPGILIAQRRELLVRPARLVFAGKFLLASGHEIGDARLVVGRRRAAGQLDDLLIFAGIEQLAQIRHALRRRRGGERDGQSNRQRRSPYAHASLLMSCV